MPRDVYDMPRVFTGRSMSESLSTSDQYALRPQYGLVACAARRETRTTFAFDLLTSLDVETVESVSEARTCADVTEPRSEKGWRDMD
jgi:hypothetical protein